MEWFRLYNKLLNDTVIQRLKESHFKIYINMLCMASIENKEGYIGNIDDLVFSLRVSEEDLNSCIKVLEKSNPPVGLIARDKGAFKIPNWSKKQYEKKKQNYMPDGESIGKYKGYVYFISDEGMSEIKIGYSKNPWSRVKDLQTSTTKKLLVLTTVRTNEVSERSVLEAFEYCKINGEWFKPDSKLISLINYLKDGSKLNINDVFNYLDSYVVASVATTTDTDTDTDTEHNKNTTHTQAQLEISDPIRKHKKCPLPFAFAPDEWGIAANDTWQTQGVNGICVEDVFSDFRNDALAKNKESAYWFGNWQTWVSDPVTIRRHEAF